MGEWLLCVLLFQALPYFARPFAAAADHAAATNSNSFLPLFPDHAAATNSSFLPLSPGLNLTIASSYNLTSGDPFSSDRVFSIATPTLADARDSFFFPILSSPSFLYTSANSTSSSSTPPFGYSLGFYVDAYEDLYMAVCAGSLGSSDVNWTNQGYPLYVNDSLYIIPYKTVDGFAAPVWIANLDKPIRNAYQASLITVQLVADLAGGSSHDDNILELQLRDGENVVWHVRARNGNVMEMQDTGYLNLIDNSTNTSHLVWQRSPIADVLVQGQSLPVGKALVSNDSSYVATMEKGGLVLYMNKTHFNRETHPPPYWVFPPYFQDPSSYKSLNQLILSAPCTNSSAQCDEYGQIKLNLGTCSSNYSSFLQPAQTEFSWLFWRLEGDGMLYSYAVSSRSGSAASVTRNSLLDSSWPGPYIVFQREGAGVFFAPLFLSWQECSKPMACGPLGVCTPGAPTWCSCAPQPDFKPVNNTNMFEGCKRSIDLPNCTSNGIGHTASTDFVELKSTASVLLFNEWTFNSTPGVEVEACKQSCSSDCSCNGFFYVKLNTSSCFFITDGITLLTMANDTNYTSVRHPFGMQFTIFARDYVTFLKVASGSNGQRSKVASGSNGQKKLKIGSKVVLIAVSALMVCVVLGMVGYLFIARRKKPVQYTGTILSEEESKELQDILPLLPNRYSYKELFEATEGFTKLLGAGGCGSVYAGLLPDGRKVAIKVLQAVLQGTQHSKQFLAEIATIGRTHHHNIVRLVGFCWEVSQRLLVYEYVERGSLDRWIFGKEPVACANDTNSAAVVATDPFLDWKTRYNVALGIARGLTYLHEDCEKPILHFDIKPQNILLDTEFIAKLADFGMSRLIDRDMSAVVTGMRGTPGYIAPEWSSQGTVSKKSDVYSMGMVLLEIVGGRRNLDFTLLNSSCELAEQEAWHFPSWAAKKCEQGMMMELVDKRLHHEGGGFDEAQARKLIHVAFWCIQENPKMRPNAPTVVQWLEGMSTSVQEPPFSMALNAGRCPNKQALAISLASQDHLH